MLTSLYLRAKYSLIGNTYVGGAGAAGPLRPSSMGDGARIALHTKIFPSLLFSELGISRHCKQFGSREFFLGQAPRPPNSRYITRKSIYQALLFWKRFKDQILALWKNIYIHRFALIGSLTLLPYVLAGIP